MSAKPVRHYLLHTYTRDTFTQLERSAGTVVATGNKFYLYRAGYVAAEFDSLETAELWLAWRALGAAA